MNEKGESYSSTTEIVPGMTILPKVVSSDAVEDITENFDSATDCKFLAPGDMDADRYVGADDLVSLRRILLSNVKDNSYATVYETNGETAIYSDVNGDEFVNLKDLVRMKKNLAENFEFIQDGFMSLNGNSAYKGKFTSILEANAKYEVTLTYKSDSPVKIKMADLGEEIIFDAVSEVAAVTKTFMTPVMITDAKGIELQIIGEALVDSITVTKVEEENYDIDNDVVDDW